MSREFDRRDFSINKLSPARQDELRERAASDSEGLPAQERVRIDSFDALTGNPSRVLSDATPAGKGNYVQRALDHLQRIGGTLGLEATQAPEYVADPHIQQTSSGAVAVHLQQHYKGIPIFQAAQAVRFTPDGALQETAGSTVTVTHDVPVAPQLSVQDAVLRAAQYVATPGADELEATDQFGQPLKLPTVDLAGFTPTVIATFPNKPERPAVLAAGPFGDQITASLIWFSLDDLRLAWEVILTMPRYEGQFRTLVDAQTGEILYCHQLIHQAAARGNIFPVDGDGPRQMVDFPRLPADYDLVVPQDLPAGFPDTWLSADSTEGNCVIARLGDDGPALRGMLQNDILVFDPADQDSDDQKVLNLFYLNCILHDYFYMLGFREADGNFQQDDFGRGGAPADRVDARVYAEPVFGTANMRTPVDGTSPIMQMGPVASTGRSTALDSTVVFHEFMHGVTNRLVGGPLNIHALDAPQSAAMGEGWGDFNACTLNDTTVVAAWAVGRPGGIRAFPYDSSYPDNFGNIGTGRYTEIHNIGEIWCATLMEMSRNIGKRLAVQLVVDALKLSPANPSFLDMRDAILTALQHRGLAGQLSAAELSAAQQGIWRAFAQFGMGPAARSNGASLSGIAADFTMPDLTEPAGPSARAETAPALGIPDNDPAGATSALTIATPGQIDRLTVAIDIEHTYIGDLQVSLVSPAGSRAILHNRAGANQRDLVKTYTSQDTPDLSTMIGEQVQGQWTLLIADLEARDEGRLRRWSIVAELAEGQPAPGARPLVLSEAAPPAPDNFQLINGIGPAIESRLRKAGVMTYAQLAALTPADVVARLGLTGIAAKNVIKQDWIGQARALVRRAEPAEAALAEAAPPAGMEADAEAAIGRQHYATFTVELLLDEGGDVRRTRVRHVQEGEQETWAGWEDGRLVQFFVEHTPLSRQSPALALEVPAVEMPGAGSSTLPVEAIERREGELRVNIGEIAIKEMADEQEPHTEIAVERLHTEVFFQVSGSAAEQATAQQLPFYIHILAHTPATGATTMLAAINGRLLPGAFDYTVRLDFEPPEIGRYQLLGTVVVAHYDAIGATIGPMLTVIP